MKQKSPLVRLATLVLALTLFVFISRHSPAFKSGAWRLPGSAPEASEIEDRPKHPNYPFLGKKAVFLGTSLTAQGLYLKPLQIKTGLAQMVNKGISGQFVRTMADRLVPDDLKGAAFVSIEGSTNDYAHGAIPGQVTDHEDANTICADLTKVVHKIRALDPSMKIYVMNDTLRGAFRDQPIPPETNENGATLEAISGAMMATAEFLQLGHWDAFHLSGITEQNLKSMTQDNLHWNEAGAELIGKAYGEYLNTHP